MRLILDNLIICSNVIKTPYILGKHNPENAEMGECSSYKGRLFSLKHAGISIAATALFPFSLSFLLVTGVLSNKYNYVNRKWMVLDCALLIVISPLLCAVAVIKHLAGAIISPSIIFSHTGRKSATNSILTLG